MNARAKRKLKREAREQIEGRERAARERGADRRARIARYCEGKIRYVHESSAVAAAVDTGKYAYACPHCRGFHLTSDPQTKAAKRAMEATT